MCELVRTFASFDRRRRIVGGQLHPQPQPESSLDPEGEGEKSMRGTNGKPTNGLTTVIELKDKEGRKIGEKEVATYRGLLAMAHDEGLRQIDTQLVQAPTKENGETAIVRAVVQTNRGTFTGIGDAAPGNVNRRIVAHLIRMAETRAKARAFRDAVNIGVVAIEELGELLDDDRAYDGAVAQQPEPTRVYTLRDRGPAPSAPAATAPPGPPPQPFPSHGDFQLMSDNQRRFLFRLAAQRGVKPEEVKDWLHRQLGVESLKGVSRNDASRLIDRLQQGGNGAAPPEVAP